jgi:peptide/nickel transport system substrate-binding protein
MRIRHRLAVAAVLAVTQSILLPGAGPGAASAGDTPPQANVLTVATTGTVDSLNPFLAQRVLPTEIHRLTYDFLTNYDPKNDDPIPAMATSWTTSPDKLTWTFTIRSGMTWSDGVKVTAGDIAWTYNLMMTNRDAATANGNFVANFKSVTAPDDSTLVVRLTKPQATMLALDIPVVPPHVWRSHVADIGKFNNDSTFPIVGDGPFVLTGYKQGQFVELSANKNYWRGPPGFDRVVFKLYKDADAEVAALRSGEVDFVGRLTPAQFDGLRGDSRIVLNKSEGKSFYALAINPGATTTSGQPFGDGNPALRDPRVRQAIRYAIDTRTLVSKTLGGYGEVGEGYLPPIFAANHWKPDPARAIGYDPTRAAALLDAAGYRKGPTGRRTTPDGRRFTLRLTGDAQRAADAQNAAYIAAWLEAVGIDVASSIVDEGRLGDMEVAGDYDLVFDGWITNPDPDYVLAIQTCGARPSKPGGSFPGDDFVCDPAYDRLYTQQIAEYDPAARSRIIKRMQERLYTDGYVNVLYYPNVLEAYRGDVIAAMTKQPQPNGMYSGQDGYWGWWSATPVIQAERPGTSAVAVAMTVGGGVVLLAAIVTVAVVRRRSTADERE